MLASLRQGDILLADAAYDSDALRQELTALGAWACVKPMPNRRNAPAFSPGRDGSEMLEFVEEALHQVSVRQRNGESQATLDCCLPRSLGSRADPADLQQQCRSVAHKPPDRGIPSPSKLRFLLTAFSLDLSREKTDS
jgi:hypothetical protein